MIYRVTVYSIDSFQQDDRASGWKTEVLYCGTSLEQARIAFLTSQPHDVHSGEGHPHRTTIIEQFESEPAKIDSVKAEKVKIKSR
jgi:hypothetical protein